MRALRVRVLRRARTRDGRSVQGVLRVDAQDIDSRAARGQIPQERRVQEIDLGFDSKPRAVSRISLRAAFVPSRVNNLGAARHAVRRGVPGRARLARAAHRRHHGGARVPALGGAQRHGAAQDCEKVGQDQCIVARPQGARGVLEKVRDGRFRRFRVRRRTKKRRGRTTRVTRPAHVRRVSGHAVQARRLGMRARVLPRLPAPRGGRPRPPGHVAGGVPARAADGVARRRGRSRARARVLARAGQVPRVPPRGRFPHLHAA